MPTEADETEVDRVEHDLNRDEHQNDVAPREKAEYSNAEKDGAQSQNRTHGHVHAAFLLPSTTAPTIAARSTSDAISKGRVNGPKSAPPIATRFPCWGAPDGVTAGARSDWIRASHARPTKLAPTVAANGQWLPKRGRTCSSGRSSNITTKR